MSFFISNGIGILISLIFYIIMLKIQNVEDFKFIAFYINSFLLLIMIINLLKINEKNKYINSLKETVRNLKKYINNLRKKENAFFLYYNETKQKNDKLIRIKHDIKNELQIAYAMMDKDKKVSTKILNELNDKLENIKIINFSKNAILNTILTLKKMEIKNSGINLEIEIDKTVDFNMEEIDICDLFSNILDNSIEATKKYNCENRFIKFCIAKKNDYIIIKCENTYEGVLKKNSYGNYITTKQEEKQHGYGINIIKNIVDKYNGEINFITKNNIFKIVIIFKEILAKKV